MTGLAGLGLLGAMGSTEAEEPNTLATSLELGGVYSGAVNHGLKITNTNTSNFHTGLWGISDSTNGRGVLGDARAGSGTTIGVLGKSASPRGVGLQGSATNGSGNNTGLLGITRSVNGTGLQGEARVSTGSVVGLRGRVTSPSGTAILGNADSGSGVVFGVKGETSSPEGFGLFTPDDAKIEGDLFVDGKKNFVQAVETPSGTRDVHYTAVEAGKVRTEVSGIVNLTDGEAVIDLPEHFEMVTSEDEPLTVQLTPYAKERAHPQVVESSTDRIVVKDFEDGLNEYTVSYTVKGIRKGYEEQEVIK
jgi:hypothetical protein